MVKEQPLTSKAKSKLKNIIFFMKLN